LLTYTEPALEPLPAPYESGPEPLLVAALTCKAEHAQLDRSSTCGCRAQSATRRCSVRRPRMLRCRLRRVHLLVRPFVDARWLYPRRQGVADLARPGIGRREPRRVAILRRCDGSDGFAVRAVARQQAGATPGYARRGSPLDALRTAASVLTDGTRMTGTHGRKPSWRTSPADVSGVHLGAVAH
jgi:hypothetical protein